MKVHLFEHDPEERTPDAVFPNNWFSTHAQDSPDKYSIVLYPLKAGSSRWLIWCTDDLFWLLVRQSKA